MPKQTFFNLNKDKQEKIVNAAIKEFSIKTFSSSSIAKIISDSRIPRGSFYQYFEDKFDIYKYIMDIIKIKKMEYFKADLNNMSTYGFFKTFHLMIEKGMKFTMDNPDLAKIGVKLMNDTDVEFKNKLLGNYAVEADQLLENLILAGIKNNELKADIDVKFMSFVLYKMMMSITTEYVKEHFSYDKVDVELEKMLEFLKHGIGTKEDVKWFK